MSALSEDAGFSRAVISIRIVDIDYYLMPLDKFSPTLAFQAARLSLLGALELPKLPTIRIFGRTPAGQKACLHLHGARPFLYVPLPHSVPSTKANSFSESLRGALEVALTSTYAHDPAAGADGQASTGNFLPRRHIDTIEPLLRTSVYGYHDAPSVFLKISVYNPRNVQRIAGILYSGLHIPEYSLELHLQPFEAHVPFILQVMTDLSLVGMGYINLSSCRFRLPMPYIRHGKLSESSIDLLSIPASERRFSSQTQHERPELFWSFPGARRTASELELDAFVEDVLNPLEVPQPKLLGQRPGPDRYAAKSLRILWLEERIRTGMTPQAPREGERAIKAGCSLSSRDLVSKLRDIVHRSLDVQESLSARGSGPLLLEMQEFQDVIQYLNYSKSTSNSQRALRSSKSDGSISSGSRDDAPDDVWEDADDWADIASSTQDVLSIPQGDGHGQEAGDKSDEEDKAARRRTKRLASSMHRRRRLVGGYKLLETVNDAKTDKTSTSPPNICGGVLDSRFLAGAGAVELRNDAVAGSPTLTENGPSKIATKARADDLYSERVRAKDSDFVHLREMAIDERVEIPIAAKVESQFLLQGNADAVRNADAVLGYREGIVGEHAHSRGRKMSELGPCQQQITKAWTRHTDKRIPLHRTICPKVGAPLRSSVAAQFGVGKLCSDIYVEPYWGNSSDIKRSDSRFGGISRRIRSAGVSGLMPADHDFEPAKFSGISCLFTSIVPVADPPLISDVICQLAGDGDKRSLHGRGSRRSHIDSAGREVVSTWGQMQETQSGTPITPPRAVSREGVAQRIRRRVELCKPNSTDSESSCGSEVEDIFNQVSVGVCGEISDSKAQISERPLSPKYDDSSFFPETPYRSRKSTLVSHDADSPIHRPRSQGCRPDARASNAVSNSHGQGQGLALATIEISAASRDKRLPDPRLDPVQAVCVISRDEHLGLECSSDTCSIFLLGGRCRLLVPVDGDVRQFATEIELLDGVALSLSKFDPDVIVGFETQMCSIGYLLDRAESLNHGFARLLSRVPGNLSGERSWGGRSLSDRDGMESAGAKYFHRKGADIKIPGRHVLNLWRIVRSEIKLDSYSLGGVARSVLGVSLPKHDDYQMETWLQSERRVARGLQHLRDKTSCCLAILDKLNVLSRTSELARVYGIDFMSVLTRGSQYRVESMLARVAHERGFLLLSAQRDQVFDQPAVECLPLVMEPSSSFYVDPVIVLDFQSLYPSMVIAHNLCFSTMLGNVNRMSGWCDEQHLGVLSHYRAPKLPSPPSRAVGFVKDGIFIAPNGEMFVTRSVRKGVLPQLLGEVLETRIMVKNAMKTLSNDHDDELFKLMNARQFGLKMIANVTYGYASASFSGRMPCSGLADAIVQCGRDALEQIVHFVDGELHDRTGAKVVYGDTDSLFVCAPGASRAEAFAIGQEITAKAASMFPTPVVLQLEKVYHPCILVTKKRYVGYAYDSPACTTPVLDAKGIETVRRDSCGAAQKTMERALRILFESKDVSRVKRFVQRIMLRICSNRMPLADFIFRKEVRLGTYKDVLPPAAVVATKAMESDPRASPRHGERVAFVVVFGGQGAALKDCVVSPREFLNAELNGSMRIHSTYYITKQIIPALDRLFSLLGARVSSWFAELPRAYFEPLGVANGSRIQSYFPASSPCVLCRGRCTRSRVCPQCTADSADRQASYYITASRNAVLTSRLAQLENTCMRCIGGYEQDAREIGCCNSDCAILFDRHRTAVRLLSKGETSHAETTWGTR